MSATTDLYRSYLDLRWHFDPAAATGQGVTSEDGRLADYSVDRMRARYSRSETAMGHLLSSFAAGGH